MTSEPDSTPRRRPPTIDLTATEVETEKPDSTAEAGAAAPPGGRAADGNPPGGHARVNFVHRLRPQAAHAVGAAIGVMAMLAVFAGLWIAGLMPSRGGSPAGAGAGVAPSAASVAKEISARLDKIEAALAAQHPDETLAARIAAADAETKALDNSLNNINRRLDDIAVTAHTALARADAATAAVDAAKSAAQAGVQRGDLDALGNRIAALERTVKALSGDVARRPASADDRAARLTVAAEALRAAVERGAPYAAELAAVKSLGVEDNASAPLAPFAADGVPSAAVLAHELATLTPALLRASGAAPREGSFLGRLEANARTLVRVSPIEAPPGDDPSAVIARIDADAARGDIAAALAEIPHLPDAARLLAENWVKKAEAREAAIAASRRVAADALAALGTPASQ